MTRKIIYTSLISALMLMSCGESENVQKKRSFSGIYPHLAYYNNEGECGTGAVVPWADHLYVITYGPHLPNGSSDKLYEIDADLNSTTFAGSIGGTPANRMIHDESNQLFIGPYVIDKDRNVKVIPYSVMQGRLTGNARHLTDPANKIMCATMEEGFYSIDVKNLDVETIFEDNNHSGRVNAQPQLLDGVHGKGVYSGQGVIVYSNNGEYGGDRHDFMDGDAGILAEWDGKDWKTVRRCQFVEVTGPGGIHGNKNPETDPIWATGWDHRSTIVAVRDSGKWSFYRLPKASHSYDGAHGWNTEWPRIRNIGTEENSDYLMTMHGMFWKFPSNFTSKSSAGIRPRSSYLKVVGDFTRWNDQIVLGCDDSAQKEFLNKRKAKGGIEGPGQSNSNLWFVSPSTLDNLGPVDAAGSLWINDEVKANEKSEPMLFGAWNKRLLWLDNSSNSNVEFTLEVDEKGNGEWSELKKVAVKANGSLEVPFDKEVKGEWIRLSSNRAGKFSAQFMFSDGESRTTQTDEIFNGIAQSSDKTMKGGLLYALGNNMRELGMVAYDFDSNNKKEVGYYQLDQNMRLYKTENDSIETLIKEHYNTPKNVISVDGNSVLVVDDYNRRWRLPLSSYNSSAYSDMISSGVVRVCREVATERDLFHAQGTFYELPAENADGYAKIRPVSSHNLNVNDYSSYRGLLLLTGIDPSKAGQNSDHIILSDDKKAAVWAGTIDDLWKLGKPVGVGGPWFNSKVEALTPSDPYLIGYYDNKELTIKNGSSKACRVTAEITTDGYGNWMEYKTFEVKANSKSVFKFPDTFDARWIRFVSDSDVDNITTTLIYK